MLPHRRVVTGVLLLTLALLPPIETASAAPPHGSDTAYAAKRVARDIATVRRQHGCQPLRPRRALRAAARSHTGLMIELSRLDHVLPGEKGVWHRITAAGYRRAAVVGEVIAVSEPDSDVVELWMASAGHRAVLTDCRFDHLGIAVVEVEGGRRWWTVDLGSR